MLHPVLFPVSPYSNPREVLMHVDEFLFQRDWPRSGGPMLSRLVCWIYRMNNCYKADAACSLGLSGSFRL